MANDATLSRRFNILQLAIAGLIMLVGVVIFRTGVDEGSLWQAAGVYLCGAAWWVIVATAPTGRAWFALARLWLPFIAPATIAASAAIVSERDDTAVLAFVLYAIPTTVIGLMCFAGSIVLLARREPPRP